MKEVYRSFDGKLGVGSQNGYIIYELSKYYEIHFLSVWNGASDSRVRINKSLLSEMDFSNSEKISNITTDIENGCGDFGQCWYKEKRYGYETICKIQARNNDQNWRKYA